MSSPWSRLWIVVGSLFTVAAVAGGTVGVVNAVAHEQTSEQDVITADVDRLRVDLANGSVTVIGDPTTRRVVVDATIDHGLRRTDYAVDVVDRILVVDGDCPVGPPFWCRVDVVVTVPADLPVEIDSHNGGVTVRDLSGPVDVHTSNGSIDARRLDGPFTARTSNGPVRAAGLSGDSVAVDTSNGPVELTFATAPTTIDVHTSNGPIDVTVPDDGTAYALDIDTNRFGTTDTAIRVDPTSAHQIRARTSNGPITVHYPTT